MIKQAMEIKHIEHYTENICVVVAWLCEPNENVTDYDINNPQHRSRSLVYKIYIENFAPKVEACTTAEEIYSLQETSITAFKSLNKGIIENLRNISTDKQVDWMIWLIELFILMCIHKIMSKTHSNIENPFQFYKNLYDFELQ